MSTKRKGIKFMMSYAKNKRTQLFWHLGYTVILAMCVCVCVTCRAYIM